jgi:hypothetical protein
MCRQLNPLAVMRSVPMRRVNTAAGAIRISLAMIKVSDLIHHLQTIDPTLPIMLRADAFTLERDPRTDEMGDDPVHMGRKASRMPLAITDFAPVWDPETGTVSLEIQSRVLVMVDSCEHYTASTALLSAAEVEARPVEFRVPTFKDIEIPDFASFARSLDFQ